jgi:hypothetical protein
LGESEGREEQRGQSEGSPLPEGAAAPERPAAGAALGVGVQALRGKPHPASDLESLDMHAGMDEPELLMALLVSIAEMKAAVGRREWTIVAGHARQCVEALEKANETPRR